MIEPGSQLEIHYPSLTDVRFIHNAERRRRNLEVLEVRDLLQEPLTVDEFLFRPYVARSRWLAVSKDLDTGDWRQFYLGTANEFASPGTLRLALYEPESPKPAEFIAREFLPTERDRKLMVRLLERWKDQDHGDLQLRVCCYDLRLIR